jgi:type VI secretion system protein ImpF
MKDSVRRDLEWLLNSRRTPEEPPSTARELLRSVYWYGLPDITSFAMATEEARFELAHRIQVAVANFEPRLLNVQVRLMPSPAGSRILQFQIEALLRVEPAPARVYFDTTLEMVKGEYQVAGDRNAR